MTNNPLFKIRPVEKTDRAQWDSLYEGYATFYKVEQTQQMRDIVWSWLHDKNAETNGLVAEGPEGLLIGLTHYRPYARPLSASTGCFLDDIFVAPTARGSGVADALIDAVKNIAIENSWTVVRWITADDNYRGRNVYDRVASRTPWITYDIKL